MLYGIEKYYRQSSCVGAQAFVVTNRNDGGLLRWILKIEGDIVKLVHQSLLRKHYASDIFGLPRPRLNLAKCFSYSRERKGNEFPVR